MSETQVLASYVVNGRGRGALIELCWKIEDLHDVNEVVLAAVPASARSGSHAVTA